MHSEAETMEVEEVEEEEPEEEEEEVVEEEVEVDEEDDEGEQPQKPEEKPPEGNEAKPQAQDGHEARTASDPAAALLQSLNGLFDLNGALSEFVRQWHALRHDLDSILSSIDCRSKELDERAGGPCNANASDAPPAPAPAAPKVVDRAAELLSICESTSSRALRKFVVAHLSDLGWLRREVPAALRRSPSPARLALDSLGRFYLQGRKAYDRPRDDPMVVFRRSCILILEFYILSECSSPELEDSVKKDAQVAALSWRSRLVNEGGVQAASAVDALGLVLFLASFGIPKEFGGKDMYDLLRLSNLKRKADVLRKSPILCEKMPDVINDMLIKEMNIEAVDLICTFELKEKFPPLPLLVSFMQKYTQSAKVEYKEGQSSLKSQREANEKQLERLKFVVKCLEDYNLDPSELASFNINQTIAKLEKEIAMDDERLKTKNLKRKAQESQLKSYWHSSAKPSPGMMPRFGRQFQEQKSSTLPNSESYYGSLYQRNVPNDGLGLHNNGSGVPSLAGSVHTSAVSGSEQVATTAEGGAGLTVGNSSHPYTNFSGGEFGLHGNGTVDERSVGQNMLGPAHSEAWMGPSPTAGQNMYYPQASGTGYGAGSLSTNMYQYGAASSSANMYQYGTGSSGANLYHFSDTVLEREAYYANSGISNPAPSGPNQSYDSSYIS